MSTLQVLNLIKEKGIEAVKEHGIEVRDYPDRVVLNYSMMDSPKHDPIAKECRASILRKPLSKEGEWKVLARSLNTKCPAKWLLIDLETGDIWRPDAKQNNKLKEFRLIDFLQVVPQLVEDRFADMTMALAHWKGIFGKKEE